MTSPRRHYEHLISEALRAETCRYCQAPVIRALTGGLDITCNPTRLDPQQELHARLAGHHTYAVIRHQHRLELTHRDLDRIRAHHDTHVVADHRCAGRQLLPPDHPAYPTNPQPLTLRAAAQEMPDDPPF